MAAAQMETAAQRYRRLAQEKTKRDGLQDVTCDDCGMVWRAARLGMEFFVQSGILPLDLVDTMLKAAKSGGVVDPAKILSSMAEKEIRQSIEFSAKVVLKTAVEPRIVKEGEEQGDNDISREEVLTCCFARLLNWQLKGGEEAARLGNFPGK